MADETVIEKVKIYADIVRARYPVKMVILYGSYSRGNNRDDSDIDVAVIFDKLETDRYKTAVDLFKLRRSIDSRIEPVLLESDNDVSGFLESIMQHGMIIYPERATSPTAS